MMKKMNIKLLICMAACLTSIALAEDFKTVDHKEYKNAKVSRVEPDGIVIVFSGGIVKLPFVELPPEVQKKYGYDSQAAVEFQQKTYQADVDRARQLAESREKRQKDLEEQARSQPQPPPQERQSIAASMHGSTLDQRSSGKTVINGTIARVVDEGLEIRVSGIAFVGQERILDGTYVLFLGSHPGFYDDDRVQAVGIPAGSRDHTTVGGNTLHSTVRAFESVQITKLP
jgi:hypothetical protein